MYRYLKFGGCGLASSVSEIKLAYSPWSSENLINRNRLKKFMQVGIEVKCMHTNFGGCGLFGFGDKISLLSIKVEKFNRSESAQKIYASRD